MSENETETKSGQRSTHYVREPFDHYLKYENRENFDVQAKASQVRGVLG
jgi:hypothetical protein